MNFKKHLAPALLLAGLASASSMAHAVPIVGSITLNGFFSQSFAPGGTSIVSNLTSISSLAPGLAGGGDGSFSGSGGPVSPIGVIPLGGGGLPATIYTLSDGTVFTATSVFDLVRTALTCTGDFCFDVLNFRLQGTVARTGFDPTAAVVTWTGQGSCVGSTACTSTPSASWSARLTGAPIPPPVTPPPVTPPPVTPPPATPIPEPGTLALFGLGLLGVGLRRLTKAR